MRQMALHETFMPPTNAHDTQLVHVKLLNWNIRNPSLERAKRQADWLIQTDANIIILTEAKYSQGCFSLCHVLESYGFRIFFPQPTPSEYCVIVAAKDSSFQELELNTTFLSHRIAAITCNTYKGQISIIGLYVPSRGAKERRNVDKRMFQEQMMNMLNSDLSSSAHHSLIMVGDLNVLERNHLPHYPVFGEWEYLFYESFLKKGLVDVYRLLYPTCQEYSWFGRKGNGYRFDHIFISNGLSHYVTDCCYVHEVRTQGLSDHSGMFLTLSLHDETS